MDGNLIYKETDTFSELDYKILCLQYPLLRKLIMSSYETGQREQLLDFLFALDTDSNFKGN